MKTITPSYYIASIKSVAECLAKIHGWPISTYPEHSNARITIVGVAETRIQAEHQRTVIACAFAAETGRHDASLSVTVCKNTERHRWTLSAISAEALNA